MRPWAGEGQGFVRLNLDSNYSGLTCHCDTVDKVRLSVDSTALVLSMLGQMLKAKVPLDKDEKTMLLERQKREWRLSQHTLSLGWRMPGAVCQKTPSAPPVTKKMQHREAR